MTTTLLLVVIGIAALWTAAGALTVWLARLEAERQHDLPPVRTKERLAQALHAAGLSEMAEAARAGRYDDFESESATPCLDLVRDLRRAGKPKLAERAADGEWDSTRAEAEEWFEREGRQVLARDLERRRSEL